MKNLTLICTLLLVILSSCESDKDHTGPGLSINIDELINKNIEKISINTGIAGTLLKKEGNCMPVVGGKTNCKTYPIKRTILIYEITTKKDVEGWGPFYNSVNTKLIASQETDQDGFFQVTVAPGRYSVFVSEYNDYYASLGDGNGNINPVTVIEDSISIMRVNLNYAVY